MELDLEQLKQLMRSVKEHDIRELEVERDGERIVLRRGPAVSEQLLVGAGPSIVAPPIASGGPAAASPAPEAEVDDPNVAYITSPFVGTFYRSPSPEAASFVSEGATIKPGQVLCIVEAMKLMNEIEADVGGTLVEILVENGKPVEYGDRLFKVRKG